MLLVVNILLSLLEIMEVTLREITGWTVLNYRMVFEDGRIRKLPWACVSISS